MIVEQQSHTIETLLLLLQEQREQNQALQTQLASQLSVIEQLTAQIEKLQRMLFGQKTERLSRLNPEESQGTQVKRGKTRSSEIAPPNGRRVTPVDLPRENVRFDIPEAERYYSSCDVKLHQVGKDVSEQLDVVPIKLFVRQFIRYKYACRCCQRVFVAKMPEQPIDKGLAAERSSTTVFENVSRLFTSGCLSGI